MTKQSIDNSNKPDFITLIPDSSNEEILSILKKRKQYQKEAAEIALKEAIKRGLINSEQDLFSEEFSEEPFKMSLFPSITKEYNRNRIRKSIARLLLLVGSFPSVWGILNIIEGTIPEGVILAILGGIWIFASVQLIRSMSFKMVNILFVMLFASVAYLVKILLEMKNLVVMDFVIPAILFSFITYGLLFIRKLGN